MMPGYSTGLAVPFSTISMEIPESAGLSIRMPKVALLWVSEYVSPSFQFISCLMPITLSKAHKRRAWEAYFRTQNWLW